MDSAHGVRSSDAGWARGARLAQARDGNGPLRQRSRRHHHAPGSIARLAGENEEGRFRGTIGTREAEGGRDSPHSGWIHHRRAIVSASWIPGVREWGAEWRGEERDDEPDA